MRSLLPAFLAVLTLAADPLPSFDVFPGKPPGETLTMKEGQDPHGTKTPGHRGNVFTPELTPWPSSRPNSPIILICPGGGYSGLADGHEGDEVVLFGENPTVSFIAEKLGTISYEILTSISQRVKRVFYRE